MIWCDNNNNYEKKYILGYAKSWFAHTAAKVLENEKMKVLWDFTIQTDDGIQALRSQIWHHSKERRDEPHLDYKYSGAWC